MFCAAGIDVGTTNIAGVLVDVETRREVCALALPSASYVVEKDGPRGQSVQDIGVIGKKALEVLGRLLDEARGKGLKVGAIGVTGQMHGIVYLDAKGKPLSDLINWQDRRGEAVCGRIKALTGYAVPSGYGVSSYFYDFLNDRVPEGACHISTAPDYVAGLIGGAFANVTHPQNGAGIGLFDIKNCKFDIGAIDALGLDPSFFPQVAPPYFKVGSFEGIPVSVAIGDNQAGVIGAVRDFENSVLVNIGTGSQVSAVVDRIEAFEGIELRPFEDGKYLATGAALCGGSSLALLAGLISETAEATGGNAGDVYGLINRIAGDSCERSPLDVNTRFSGTRQDPLERGSIANISGDNLTLANLIGGFLDGISGELASLYKKIKNDYGPRKIVVGSGGGMRKCPSLRARVARDFGANVILPVCSEEAACGAAVYGAMCGALTRK